MGKRNHTHCERCRKEMTRATQFGDSFMCTRCVETCTDCGVYLHDKNRVCNQCSMCHGKERYTGSCCVCGASVHHSKYKDRGNWCLKCERKALRVRFPELAAKEKEGRNYVFEIVKLKYKNTCTACGRHQSTLDKRGFDVVFKDGRVKGMKYISKKDVDKLTLLCRKCSRKKLSTAPPLQT
jgi:hypothetical protein